MTRPLRVLGAGYDPTHAEIFISIEQVGLVNPSSRATLTQDQALDLIRGLAAAIQHAQTRPTKARA